MAFLVSPKPIMRLHAIVFTFFAANLIPDYCTGSIYFATSNTGRIRRVETYGTGLQTLVDTSTTGIENARGLAVDPIGERVYFSGEGRPLPDSTRIASVTLGGNSFDTLIEGSSTRDMEVDPSGGKLYFSKGSRALFRVNLDGSSEEQFDFSFLGNIDLVGLALDIAAGKMYFADNVAGRIYRSNLDGSDLEQVIQLTASTNITDLELDALAGTLFWVDSTANKMQRAQTDGSSLQDVVVGSPGFHGFAGGLALDVPSQAAYWSTPGSPFGPDNPAGIFKAHFDGTGLSQVLVSDESIQGLDFGPAVPLGPIGVVPEPVSIAVWAILAIAVALRSTVRVARGKANLTAG